MQWREHVAELSDEQIKGIAEISRDIGQVSVASIVIPFLVTGFSPERIPLVLSGAALAIFAWSISIVFLKNL